jgi:hypothetical protein
MTKIETRENSWPFDSRPSGRFTVLDKGIDYKVKRIEVLPWLAFELSILDKLKE